MSTKTVPIKLNETYEQLLGPDKTLRKDVRYFEVYGGRRSAKSHEVMQILGITALAEPGHFIPCIRKVATTLKDSVFAEVCGFFNEHEIKVYINKSDKEVVLPNGSRFRCFGLDDPSKHKSIKDPTILWVEEADEVTEDDADSLDAGLSPQKYPGRIVFTHNPIPTIQGSRLWLQSRFLQIPHELSKAVVNKEKNALVLRTWYKDNAFCPQETIDVLEGYQVTNPEKYKLWALGEFTKLEGTVFDNWDIVPYVPPELMPNSLGVGLDFGFSNDPNAAMRVWKRNNELWLKQLVYKTGLHNEMLYSELSESGVDGTDDVVADSSRPDIIDDLFSRGLKRIRGVKKYKGYKEDVANRLKAYRLHIVEGSTDLIKEISTYSWAKDKRGKPLPVLQDGDDHLMDCLIMLISEHKEKLSWELLSPKLKKEMQRRVVTIDNYL